MKHILTIAAGWVLGNVIWDWLKPYLTQSETPAGTEVNILGAGISGSTGSAVSGTPDYSALAAAIQALAAGVQLPLIQNASIEGASGDNTLIVGEGGKLFRILAYVVTGAGAPVVKFRSGSTINDLWRVDLDAPAGNSGANLATSWPGYLFTTQPGDSLTINLSASARVSVTYWKEGA